MHSDDLAKLTRHHELDQAIEGAKTMAKLLRGYFLELRSQGFSASEALTLVVEYQRSVMMPRPPQGT